MAIVFPASPSVNDTFTAGSITYKWDGSKWIGLGVTPTDKLIEGSNTVDLNGNSLEIGGTPPWSVTGGDYNNLSIRGGTASSSGFMWLGNGTATNNGDFDLGRINFLNGPTIVSQIKGTTDTSANDDGRISFFTKSTGNNIVERVRITGGGDVGINQTSPTSQSGKVLHISGDTGGQARIHLSTSASGHGVDEGHYIVSQGSESGAVAGQLAIINMENRNITFTTGSAGANTTRLTIQHDGNLNIADGNLIVAAGHGIDFSANSNASGMTSELLNDYEEGTWTPTLTGFTNAGTISGRVRDYIKIGKQVTVWFDIFQTNNNMSFANGATITGLPFSTTTFASGDQFHTKVNVHYYRGGGTIVNMTAYLEASDTIIITGASANSDIRHVWGHVTYPTT